ncbi:MAG: DUF4199 domain-containing protein [Saprospiraceae bacterium]|nr:DUF4199 domain-containing protein [Saprospiraceae bacterium]
MRVETKWATLTSIAILLWMLFAQALGFYTLARFSATQWMGIIASISIYIIAYYMVTKQKRDLDFNGVMTWAEGFWAAARMTLIYIPISSLVLYIYIQYLNPGYKAFVASSDFGKDPVNTFLMDNLSASFLFGGLFCLVFPLFTRRSLQQKK